MPQNGMAAQLSRLGINPYTTLEISPSATVEQVKAAYKKMALGLHPDRAQQDAPESEVGKITELFKKVSLSRDVLCDADQRRLYDAQMNKGKETPPAPGGRKPKRSPLEAAIAKLKAEHDKCRKAEIALRKTEAVLEKRKSAVLLSKSKLVDIERQIRQMETSS